jgi:hypothetical protein
MAMKAVLKYIDHTKGTLVAFGTVTVSGNYGTSGGALPHGDTLDFSQLGIATHSLPYQVELWSTPPQGAAPLNDTYTYMPGTTLANGVVQVSLAGTEFTPGNPYSGASPTNVAGYVLNFQAEFAAFT